ncbi:hypothetical protein ACEQ6C_38865, partial [Rhizobium ruizarguesonis]
KAAIISRLSCQRGNGRKISLLTSTNCEQNASFSFRPKVASANSNALTPYILAFETKLVFGDGLLDIFRSAQEFAFSLFVLDF